MILTGWMNEIAAKLILRCQSLLALPPARRKSHADCPRRAGFSAFAAADTLCRIRCFDRIDLHPAFALTLPAVHTLIRIHFQSVYADLIAQPVYGAKGAERSTEETVDQNAPDHRHDQDHRFQGKKRSDRLLQRLMG